MRLAACVLLISVFVGSSNARGEAVQVKDLRCEYLNDPKGIDTVKPRLSWVVESAQRGQRQTAYEVLVASTPAALDHDQGDVWSSGKVTSGRTAQIVYGGSPLTSRKLCFWKVRCWDRDGQPSGWSKPASW
jgi:alpha-L-rhamnosidase